MSLTLTLPHHAEAQLRELAQQQGVSAEDYAAQLLESFAQRRELQEASESQLLQRLGFGFTEREWERYRQLVELRREANLDAAEQRELLSLSEQLEQANAKRMGVLAELAKRRQAPLETLMQEVGITQPNLL